MTTILQHDSSRSIQAVLILAAAVTGIIFSPFVGSTYWDEIAQYQIGQFNLNQYALLIDGIFGTSLADSAYSNFDNFVDRDYGSVFEVIIAVLGKIASKALPGFDLSHLIILKHIAVYLIFLLGTCSVYAIAKRRIGNAYGGLLAAALFFLSPRIFGNAFYNSKDIVFLSFFVISVNYILAAAESFRLRSVCLAALFTALAASARIIGVFSLFLGIFVFFVSWHRQGLSFRKTSAGIAGFVLLTLMLVYSFYPFLWPSPVSRMSDIISAMSKFTRHPDIGLFNGRTVQASKKALYLFRWMASTLPFIFMIAALFGSLPALAIMLKRTFSLSLWKNNNELCDYVTAGLGICPVIVSLVKHPWLYDGWRHFYFLVPFLSVSAAVGIFNAASLFAGTKSRKLAAVWLASVAIAESLAGILVFFPYPNCYFNASAGSGLIRNYELDYSGTSGYEALVRIISYHGNISKPINVTSDSIDLRQIRPRLGAARHLININEKVMPDYVLSNRREIPEIEKKLYHEVSSIQTLGGEVIMRILVPNENRDSYCKSHAQECRISVW